MLVSIHLVSVSLLCIFGGEVSQLMPLYIIINDKNLNMNVEYCILKWRIYMKVEYFKYFLNWFLLVKVLIYNLGV